MSPNIRHMGYVGGFLLTGFALTAMSLAAVTTQPSSTQPSAASGQSPAFTLLASDSTNATLHTLFAPRTEQEYFSPFDDMNPAHMRPDMPLQIGSYEDLHLYMGLLTVGRFQAITQQNVSIAGVSQQQQVPGIQDPFADLEFLASIPDKLDIYMDLYIASRPHPNTMYAHEGYLLFKQMPGDLEEGPLGQLFNYVNLKVGAFDIDFGDDNYRRSNNAYVQDNPLIANPIVDPNVEELGGELYSIKGPVYWLLGVTSGTTTEYFDYGSTAAVHAKIWANPIPEVRTSVSGYYVDLSQISATSDQASDLYNANRSGEPFGGIFGNGDDPGSIQPAGGRDVTAVQGDVTWLHWPIEVYGNVGYTQDANTSGAGAPAATPERWTYGTIEPVYHFTPAFYAAARYSAAFASSVHGVGTDGWADRIEGGLGYWLTNDILLKGEWVYESYHDFGANTGEVSGVEAAPGPRFNGALLEVSWSL